MKRRHFIALLGGAAASGPLGVRAQPATKLTVGWLSETRHPFLPTFRSGLEERGYREPQNLAIIERYAEGDAGRFPALVDELVAARCDVLAVSGSSAFAAVYRHPTRLPVVFVTSLAFAGGEINYARPGRNFTGIALQFDQLAAKWPELLKTAFPALKRIGITTNEAPSVELQIRAAADTARALGMTLVPMPMRRPEEIAPAIAKAAADSIEAMITTSSPFFAAQRHALVAEAAARKLPAIYEHRAFVEAGGLMSYGPNLAGAFRQMADLVARIHRGAKPGEIPIEQVGRFELVVNLGTAKAQGFELPPAILLRADEVIE